MCKGNQLVGNMIENFHEVQFWIVKTDRMFNIDIFTIITSTNKTYLTREQDENIPVR
jgi:hypothetical protein